MVNKPGRAKWGDIVLKRGYALNPETPAQLAAFLMDTMNKESDGEALTLRAINEIADSGPAGLKLLEDTRRRDDYWFAGRSVASLAHSVARIRAMIAGRLGR